MSSQEQSDGQSDGQSGAVRWAVRWAVRGNQMGSQGQSGAVRWADKWQSQDSVHNVFEKKGKPKRGIEPTSSGYYPNALTYNICPDFFSFFFFSVKYLRQKALLLLQTVASSNKQEAEILNPLFCQ